jgi:hypothetical protein
MCPNIIKIVGDQNEKKKSFPLNKITSSSSVFVVDVTKQWCPKFSQEQLKLDEDLGR